MAKALLQSYILSPCRGYNKQKASKSHTAREKKTTYEKRRKKNVAEKKIVSRIEIREMKKSEGKLN